MYSFFNINFLAMQCEKGTSYKPCVSTCPQKSCNNLARYNSLTINCKNEACVEGCAPEQCEEGQVFNTTNNFQVILFQKILNSFGNLNFSPFNFAIRLPCKKHP